MVEFTKGDIIKADTDKFPENFYAYALACKKHQVLPGKMFVFDTGSLIFPKNWIPALAS